MPDAAGVGVGCGQGWGKGVRRRRGGGGRKLGSPVGGRGGDGSKLSALPIPRPLVPLGASGRQMLTELSRGRHAGDTSERRVLARVFQTEAVIPQECVMNTQWVKRSIKNVCSEGPPSRKLPFRSPHAHTCLLQASLAVGCGETPDSCFLKGRSVPGKKAVTCGRPTPRAGGQCGQNGKNLLLSFPAQGKNNLSQSITNTPSLTGQDGQFFLHRSRICLLLSSVGLQRS